MASRIGTGTALTFGTTTALDALEVTNFTQEGRSVPAADSSHMESSSERTKKFGTLEEPGTMTVEVLLDPDLTVPLGVDETITLTYIKETGESTGATYVGTGAVTEVTETIPLEEMMSATLTITKSAKWTRTAGS